MWFKLNESEQAVLLEALTAAGTPEAANLASRLRAEQDGENDATVHAYRQAADDKHLMWGELEFDRDAVVSLGDDPGAYVMGWRWVTAAEAGLPDDEEEEQVP